MGSLLFVTFGEAVVPEAIETDGRFNITVVAVAVALMVGLWKGERRVRSILVLSC